MQPVELTPSFISNLTDSQKDDIFFKIAEIATDRFGVQGVKNAYHLAQDDLKLYPSDARNVLTHIGLIVKARISQRILFASDEQKTIFTCKLFTALKENIQLSDKTSIDLSFQCSFLINTFKSLNIPCDCCDFPYLYRVSIQLDQLGYMIKEHVFTYIQITLNYKLYIGKEPNLPLASNYFENPLSPN